MPVLASGLLLLEGNEAMGPSGPNETQPKTQ